MHWHNLWLLDRTFLLALSIEPASSGISSIRSEPAPGMPYTMWCCLRCRRDWMPMEPWKNLAARSDCEYIDYASKRDHRQ
jgi:hypothetical protein